MPLFEFAVPYEVFGRDRSDITPEWYEFRLYAGEDPLSQPEGLSSERTHALSDLGWADTVVVPGWRDVDEVPPAGLLEALRTASAAGARLVSVCSGAFVLAAAGLLNGRRATTHWRYCADLAARYPDVRVDGDALYTEDHPVFTSAGSAAGIDLCLAIVRRDFGADVAARVARRLVASPHRAGGQAQYAADPVLPEADEHALARTIEWALDHLGDRLSVAALARRAAMSERTFARRFRAATGSSAGRWLIAQRVLLARRLLETTDATVERVAARCGMGSSANLRRHFKKIVGVAPDEYRKTFSGGATRSA